MNKIPLIYILSVGHSGSTLLDILIGNHPEVESTGEVFRFKAIASDSVFFKKEENYCSCNKPIDQCEVWSKVIPEMLDNEGHMLDLRSQNDEEFNNANQKLFEKVMEVTGSKIISDSSKTERRLERLIQSEIFDVTIVHLVRDPRAVVNSFKKKAERKGKKHVYESETVIKEWKNNLDYYNKYKNQKYIKIKYRDLVQKPIETLNKIYKKAGLNEIPADTKLGNKDNHLIAGNRMRLIKDLEIRFDDSYLSMSKFEWFKVTIKLFGEITKLGLPILKK